MMACRAYIFSLAVLLVTTVDVNSEAAAGSAKSWHVVLGHSSCPQVPGVEKECMSLEDAWSLAAPGDIIRIEKGVFGGDDVACQGTSLTLPGKAVTVSGGLNNVTIGCSGGADLDGSFVITNPESTSKNRTITIRNVVFVNMKVNISGMNVLIENTTFTNSSLNITTAGGNPGLLTAKLHDVSISGYSVCQGDEACQASAYLFIEGSYQRVTVSRCRFSQARSFINIQGTDSYISVADSTFGNDIVRDRAVMGGLVVGLWPMTFNSTVHVERTIFINQFNWSPVDAVMNIFEAAIRVFLFRSPSTTFLHPQNASTPNIGVRIEQSKFVNNERGFTAQGNIDYIIIEDSEFVDNVAMHAGAGVLHLTQDITIRGCTFINNSAGNIRSSNILQKEGLVVLSGDEARVHSKCCKGSVTLLGKGGAIRVQRGKAIIENTTFSKNTARISGGTLFVDRGSSLELHSSRFANGLDRSVAPQQGEILYSNGHVIVYGGFFDVHSATSHVSIFQHNGDRWSIEVYDISVQCPMGFNIRVTNTTSYRVVDSMGLKRSYKLDQLSHYCESCPRYKYSIDNGYMTYSLDHGVPDYFALMINEEYPEVSKHERYSKHAIRCKICPYGGTCEARIRAIPNFWGYQTGDRLLFQVCPKGYCCSSLTSCVDYDTCGPHRTGRLCGLCEAGYTEALYSPKCVKNETCGPPWIWPFAFGTGVIYMLFLLFQKDIRVFLFSGDINVLLSYCRCRSLRKSPRASLEENVYMIVPGSGSPAVDEGDTAKTDHITEEDGLAEGTHEDDHSDEKQQSDRAKGRHHQNTLANGHKIPVPADDGSLGSPAHKADDGSSSGSAEEENNDEEGEEETVKGPPASANDMGAIMLILIMYYFQDAMLFHVPTILDKPEARGWSQLKKVLLGLFKFRLEISHFVDNVCLLPGVTASQKLLAKTIIVPFILLLFVMLYTLHAAVTCLRRATTRRHDKDADSTHGGDAPTTDTFVTRLASGFMLTLLFMYQLLATTAFKLLNCVQVGPESVLYLEGTVTCYELWQYGVVAYALCCIIPFCFALMIGPGMLKEKRISVLLFFVACIVPLPFVVHWVILRLRDNHKKNSATRRPPSQQQAADLAPPDLSPSEETILRIMHGPFRDIKTPHLGPICWSGTLIFRRLVLILFYTFINNSLIRILCMLFFCFLYLLVHVTIKPYQDPRVNVAGSVSVSALMVVGGVNLIRASFEVAEYVPRGPNLVLIGVMKECEDVLMLWIPLITMSFILLVLTVKILMALWRAVRRLCGVGGTATST